MTHTMHRRPPDANDFIIHIRSSAATKEGSGEKIRRCLEEILPLKPIAFGSPALESTLTSSLETVMSNIRDGVPLHVTFSQPDNFYEAIRRLKRLNTGLSVAVSAPYESLDFMRHNDGIEPMAYQIDFGHLSIDPTVLASHDPWLLDIVSLCGHLRVSPAKAKKLAAEIINGKSSPIEAAKELAKVCKCGCFNVDAAAQIFSSLPKL